MRDFKDSAGTVDTTLANTYIRPTTYHPFDVKIGVRFWNWVDTTDHSQGFERTDSAEPEFDIELIDYMEYGELQALIQEIEDFRRANYGVIKASAFTQEFSEETEGSTSGIGTLLKRVLTENDSSNLYATVDNGLLVAGFADVHLWEMVVKIGDSDRDIWLDPPFSFIYGWRFDTATETVPSWDKVSRKSPQFWRVTGYSLYHWMDKVESGWLGDYKNPAPVWGDRSSNEELDPEDDAYVTAVGNYPVLPVIRKMFNECGVTDANIEALEIPVDTGATPDYSTVDFTKTLGLDTVAALKQSSLPDTFHWKTLTDDDSNNIHYHVWVGYEDSIVTTRFQVSAWNEATGETITEDIDITALLTGESCPNTAYIRRLWYPGSGNDCYMLVEDTATSPDDWYIYTVTLAGTIGSVGSSSSATEDAIDDPAGSYERHWGQCDLDQDNGRLYAAICYNSGANSYLVIGYWTLSTGSWTAEYTLSPGNYTMIFPGGANSGEWVTGFRCLTSGTDHAICFFALQRSGSNSSVMVVQFDDSQAAPEGTPTLYDSATGNGAVAASEWLAWPVMNGRGSIGGFVDSGTAYFICTSVEWTAKGTGRLAYWVEWDIGTNYTNLVEGQVGGDNSYRTFNSHGSANLDYCLGYSIQARGISDASEYYTMLYETYFHISGGSKTAVRDTTYGVWATGHEKEWPVLGAPSITAYSGSAANTKYRPFTYWKTCTNSEGNTQRRMFLVIFSEAWIPQFSHDFYTDGGSIADELQDMAFAYALTMRCGLWSSKVLPRTTSDTSVKSVTTDFYEYNGVMSEYNPRYDKVVLNWAHGTVNYPSTSKSNNSWNITTNYVIGAVGTAWEDTRRATKRAEELHGLIDAHYNKYTLKASHLLRLEPLDPITITLPEIPNGRSTVDVDARVVRITIDNGMTQLEAVDTTAANLSEY